MKKSGQGCLAVFLLMIFCFTQAAHAGPLSFLPFVGKSGEMGVAEARDYIVIFTLSDRKKEFYDYLGRREKWRELGYKFVNRAEDPAKLFSSSGWVEVRFLDEEDFAVGRAAIPFGDLQVGREYYGFVWIPAKRADDLKTAQVREISEADAMKIQEEEENRRLQSLAQEEKVRLQTKGTGILGKSWRAAKRVLFGWTRLLTAPFRKEKPSEVMDAASVPPAEAALEQPASASAENLSVLEKAVIPAVVLPRSAGSAAPMEVLMEPIAPIETEARKPVAVVSPIDPDRRYTNEDIAELLEIADGDGEDSPPAAEAA